MRGTADNRAVRIAPERYIFSPRERSGADARSPPTADGDFTAQRRTEGMEKVSLTEAFGSFDETWSPRLVGELNEQAVKLGKADGKFLWHRHENANELFFVHSGQLRIGF